MVKKEADHNSPDQSKDLVMVNFRVARTLKDQMGLYPEVNWSGVLRKFLQDKLDSLKADAERRG